MLLGNLFQYMRLRPKPTDCRFSRACIILLCLFHILSPTAANAQTVDREALESIKQLLDAVRNASDDDSRQALAEQVLIEFGRKQQSRLSDLYGSAITIPPLLSPPRPVMPNSAEVYSFSFDEKLVHLVRQEFSVQVHEVAVTAERLATAIKYYVQELQISSSFNGMERGSTELYQWLVQPYAAELQQAGIDRLIFFTSDPLRNLPLATLFDGRRYLIDDFEVLVSFGADEAELSSVISAPPSQLTAPPQSSNTGWQIEFIQDGILLSQSYRVLEESLPAFQLQGSHLAVGAKVNLVGLWPGNDQSTAQLLDRFITRLDDSLDHAAALRDAQLQLKESTRFGHPFYWGAFLLVEQ